MAIEFEFHEVDDGLFVGPCPASPEKVQALKQRGITGLVCVQTDGDLDGVGVPWPLLWKVLMGQGIACARQPITDFDNRSLLANLTAAVDCVRDMRLAGRPTYLHCTAGINRSSTVAIAYLVRDRGMKLAAAIDQVEKRRPAVMPNHGVLLRWAEKLGLG